jgi:1-acyl-sn-glycerol-3-phosphate acyltransferase
MWWDGLLPLFLSRNIFDQKARAIMENKQMRKHKFFARIGAFSINLSDPKSILRSLRYAIESLENPNISLYIYPEGELTPVSESKPNFKKGLAWIYKNLDQEVDFVPISFYTHSFTDSKPELYINIGERMKLDRHLSKEDLTTRFEDAVHRLLLETREVAGFSDEGFSKS